MNHTALPQNDDGLTLEQKRQTGLGWQEFFQQLGRTTTAEDPRGSLPELIQE